MNTLHLIGVSENFLRKFERFNKATHSSLEADGIVTQKPLNSKSQEGNKKCEARLVETFLQFCG